MAYKKPSWLEPTEPENNNSWYFESSGVIKLCDPTLDKEENKKWADLSIGPYKGISFKGPVDKIIGKFDDYKKNEVFIENKMKFLGRQLDNYKTKKVKDGQCVIATWIFEIICQWRNKVLEMSRKDKSIEDIFSKNGQKVYKNPFYDSKGYSYWLEKYEKIKKILDK